MTKTNMQIKLPKLRLRPVYTQTDFGPRRLRGWDAGVARTVLLFKGKLPVQRAR